MQNVMLFHMLGISSHVFKSLGHMRVVFTYETEYVSDYIKNTHTKIVVICLHTEECALW